jgi:integrase
MTRKLTAKTKASHKRTDEDIFALPDGGHGFGGPVLDVRCNGADRRWSCKVVFNGNRITVQLGTVAELSTVSAAKSAMLKARGMAKQGIDPRENLRADRNTNPTFGEHATTYMDWYVPTLKNKDHQDKWRSSVKNHCKPIWNIKVGELQTSNILVVLKPIWKKIPVMASEIRSRMEAIIDDAIVNNLRTDTTNPAVWTKQLQHALGSKPPKRGRTRGSHASVNPDNIAAVMAELRAKETQSARALYAITLSVLRSQEFVQMHTRELDLYAAQPTYTVPFERFKVDPHGKDFVVPLAPQLVKVLREQIDYLEEITGIVPYVGYLWPAVKDDAETPWISDATMLMYLKRTMGIDATVHGMRATFKTWANRQFLEGTDATPKYHRNAIEYCQAHTTPDGKASTEDPYSRDQMMLPARIGIMKDWANFCAPQKTKTDNVTPIRQAA